MAAFWQLESVEVWGGTRRPGTWQRRLGAGTRNVLEAQGHHQGSEFSPGPIPDAHLEPKSWDPVLGLSFLTHTQRSPGAQGHEVMAPRAQSPP